MRIRHSIFRAIWAAALVVCASGLSAQELIDSDFASKSAIEKRLGAVRGEIDALPAGSDPEYAELLRRLDALCQSHLSALTFAATSEARAKAAAESARAWTGYADAPPYSISRLDGIRETLADLDERRVASESAVRIVERAASGARDRLAKHQQNQRRLQDTISGASAGAAEAARALAREQVSSRIEAEEISRLEIRLQGQRGLLAALESKRDLAKRQLAAVEGNATFTKQELDTILARLNAERDPVVPAHDADPHADTTLLTWKLEFIDLEAEFWTKRFAALSSTDAATRSETLADLAVMKVRVDDWVKIGNLQTQLIESGETLALDPESLREALKHAVAIQRRIGFAIDELGGRGERGTPVFDLLKTRLASFWNAELYLVDETSYIDGKKVTTSRAVTLGKLVRLTLILAVGWLLLRFLSRRVGLLAERRKRVAPATAALITRWFFIAGFAMLVIYGMNAVHIPLAAFAFLGGALAIGIGFGAQTLVKNFISGIILVFERPIKIGDLVEVDGINGNIRSIGMRSSVIRHVDGIDTLIPNSMLLENKLTNFTFGDNSLRHAVRIGVAYGSPTREVAKILLAVAGEHGLVNDDPAPEVRFDDFGDNALIFSLLFWFDARKARREPLASDLRFMIDKALAEAGISIAFPQRDIHLDTAEPLRIQLVGESAEPKTESKPKLPQ